MLAITLRQLCFVGFLALGVGAASSDNNPLLGEIRLEPASRVENNAGVWVDGQYVGYLDELEGKGRLFLIPGEHRLLIKLAGYEDLESVVTADPGDLRKYTVAMRPAAGASYPEDDQTAKLRISVEPQRAAVFVNEVFAGHVDRFDGQRGVRLAAGTYDVRISLPGYESFETQLTLAADQEYEIKTQLSKTRDGSPQ